ncbi:MAG: TM0106 family RecB-like putative nuclease [Acidimicrobiia bacterium]
MIERLLTPSKITAWLDCAHYLTLVGLKDAGSLKATNVGVGSFAQLLMDKGMQHEHAYLEKLKSEGRDVCEVPEWNKLNETFAQWTDRVSHLLADGHDVVYQLPFVHDRMRGVADFLIKVPGKSALGDFHYEPVDAKLARVEAKPGHALQLCFYADALSAAQGAMPEQVHLYLGSGRTESIRVADVGAYWRRIRHQLRKVMDAEHDADTEPVKCKHCDFCEFADHCESEWRAADSLQFVAGIRLTESTELKGVGCETMQKLADAKPTVEKLRSERVEVLHRQAALQKVAVEGEPPPFESIPLPAEADDATIRRRQLPAPDDGDVFLDYEGHPFWTAARGLFFMFGLLTRDMSGTWAYEAWWAHDEHEEKANTARLIDWIAARREQFPGCHVYHYNHTERSSLERLAAEYGAEESKLADLVDAGVFVDVLDVVRQRVRVGAESYSLKVLELVAGYQRSHDIDKGSGAVLDYDAWCTDRVQERLDRIARYNEDDVRATMAVRDWLLAHPLVGDAFRLDIEPAEEVLDVDDLVGGLMAAGELPGDEWKQLLAHLLEYWRREWRVFWAQRVALLAADVPDQLDHPDVIAGVSYKEYRPKTGKQRKGRAVFAFPEQEINPNILDLSKKKMSYVVDEHPVTIEVEDIDADAGEFTVIWPDDPDTPIPGAVVLNDWVAARPKPATLAEYAQRVLDGTETVGDTVRRALLRREAPAFVGGTPSAFPTDAMEVAKLATALEDSYLAVQGPPGTGKTYTGSHIVGALLDKGLKVGVTAFSHHAIDNLVRAVLDEYPETKVLRQMTYIPKPSERTPGITYVTKPDTWAKGEHHLFAGTTWPLSGNTMADALDVLLIDEAGQMGLADAIAALNSAAAVVLLGDPLQLAQVSQAVHPTGAGNSTLEHVLGDDTTIPEERGVFLDITRRMHPNVCDFISELIYEERLTSHENCAGQLVDGQAGLRWERAEHDGCDTSSEVEADLVARTVRSLLGKPWIDFDGSHHTLTAADVMVVAPYNDHVNLVRATLDADPTTAAARVGTVDKFQGQEAPVVIFTMATSSGEYMPRTADFLYSRNRLNVAISRARALAYVICTEDLLDTRARSVDEMRLIGTLCAFVEATQRQLPGPPEARS